VGGEAADPLLLGQRVVAILETGLRTATYKLATLMALIEHCIENMPKRPGDVLRVPIPDLAHRVLEIYRQQVRPFEGQILSQMRGTSNETIPNAARQLRIRSGVGNNSLSVDIAIIRAPEAYEAAIDEISLCLAREPLRRLQRVGGAFETDPFRYDDAFLQQHRRSPPRRNGWAR
jgi:hypothetical protein